MDSETHKENKVKINGYNVHDAQIRRRDGDEEEITMEMLEASVLILNRTLGYPTEAWETLRSGKKKTNPKHYFIWSASRNEGAIYRLEQMDNKTGDASEISPEGTKREIFDYVTAMLKGAEEMKYTLNKLYVQKGLMFAADQLAQESYGSMGRVQ